jgi:hypothetical protein
MIWAWCTYAGKDRYVRGFWWRNLRERDRLEDPGVDMMIVLKWILKKNNGRGWSVGWMYVV